MKKHGIAVGVLFVLILLYVSFGPVFLGFSMSGFGQCLTVFSGFAAIGSFIYGFSR